MDKKKQLKLLPVDMSVGKMPPQATDIERAILGVCMLEKGALDIVVEMLRPECFYKEANQKIFKAFLSLSMQSQPVDFMTVVQELKKNEDLEIVGGAYEITKLTDGVVRSGHVEGYCRIVLEQYMKRRLIEIGGNIVQLAYDDSTDVFDLIDLSEKEVSSVNQSVKTDYTKIDEGIVDVINRIEDLRISDKVLTGIDTGFRDINRVTCGWQPTDLIVLAARPAVGKTALALNMARSAAKAGHPVGFFSLEMSKTQLIQRMLSIESELLLENISRGKFSDEGMKDLYKLGVDPLAKLPIYIDETPGINIFELRSKARKMKKNHKIEIIFIDYLQLMSGVQNGRADNREQEIAKISRDLKGLAKELQVPIIALAQLSRAVENRAGEKIPVLSDLRESGAIEQDADIVSFIYRPEYYGKNANEQGKALNGETHIKFAKNRSGALDTVILRAQLSIQKFHDVEGTQLTLGSDVPNHFVKVGSKFTGDPKDDDMPF